MTILLLQLLLGAIHISAGPNGAVAWIQPPHISAGLGWLLGSGPTGWLQFQG